MRAVLWFSKIDTDIIREYLWIVCNKKIIDAIKLKSIALLLSSSLSLILSLFLSYSLLFSLSLSLSLSYFISLFLTLYHFLPACTPLSCTRRTISSAT